MPHRTVLRAATALRRVGAGRWLSWLVRRRLAGRPLPGHGGRRRHGRGMPALSSRSTRWLHLLAAVVVMAALFTVLLSSA